MTDVAVVGAGAVGLDPGRPPGPARSQRHAVRVDRPPDRESARGPSACSARRSRSGRGSASARRWPRAAFSGTSGAPTSAVASCSASTCPEHRRALPAVRQHQPVGGRGAADRAAPATWASRSRTGHRFIGLDAGPRWRDRHLRHRAWRGGASVGLPRRDRWRPFGGSPRDRGRLRRLHVRRSVPDRRRPRRAALQPRAPLPLRPALESGSPGAAPPAARRRVADRLAGSVRRPMPRPSASAAPWIGASAPSSAPQRRTSCVWVTGYRFSQRVADAFRAGRVFLAGDAAHVMSPFGARGLNSGVADAENLAWKLASVLRGDAPRRCSTPTTPSAGPAALDEPGGHRRHDAVHGSARAAPPRVA